MADPTADYLALHREAGALVLPRDVLGLTGADVTEYLQGQLSQDVANLPEGASTWSLLLEPQGKLVAWLRVSRLDDGFVVDVDPGWGEDTRARLERFKLRSRLDVEPLPAWRCVAVRGPAAATVDTSSAEVVADPAWPGVTGVDLLGPAVTIPEGVREVSTDAYEVLRIEAGVPRGGAELSPGMLPHESGVVDRSVSWTKGCYTGQELVARVDSRGGNTPRKLVGVVVSTNVLPPTGSAICAEDGSDVGRLTSVGESLDRRAPVGLGYVKRAVELPAPVTIRWSGGEVPARVEPPANG